jgi:hypothetical protein
LLGKKADAVFFVLSPQSPHPESASPKRYSHSQL